MSAVAFRTRLPLRAVDADVDAKRWYHLKMDNNRAFSFALLASLFLPFFALAQSAQSSCPNLSRNLFFGSGGSDVIALQNFLIAQNLLPQGDNTGYFGRLTKAAAIEFQTQQSVPSTGLVGPLTRAAIAKMCGGEQTAVSNQNANTTTSNTSGSAISLTKFGPDAHGSYGDNGFYGDTLWVYGTGYSGPSFGDSVDIYVGNTLAEKGSQFIRSSCPNQSSTDCFYVLTKVPQLAPGTYPVTVVHSGVTSNSLPFTVESGKPTSCPRLPIQCISGYRFVTDNDSDGKGCSLRSSCVPIATSTFQI
jgi:peptidoglycan hydrolase-like protein with peptidoglycan-binding domain